MSPFFMPDHFEWRAVESVFKFSLLWMLDKNELQNNTIESGMSLKNGRLLTLLDYGNVKRRGRCLHKNWLLGEVFC